MEEGRKRGKTAFFGTQDSKKVNFFTERSFPGENYYRHAATQGGFDHEKTQD
jgi:hypothetical protein